MLKRLLIIISLLFGSLQMIAQHTSTEAYDKFLQLTAMFHGSAPYSCNAIVEISYRKTAKSIRDTSKLIYKNGSTYYKSRLVEHIEDWQGELIINHELKTATFTISDSLRLVIERDMKLKRNKELESMLDSNIESHELQAFNKYVNRECNVTWATKGEGIDEITVLPKNPKDGLLLSMKLRFWSNVSKIVYYEYTNKEPYAYDPNGNTKYRIVTTIYDKFIYGNVPDIPSKLSDFLTWDGWTVTLKKYSNYKFSLL